MTSEAQKSAQRRYLSSDKGKAWRQRTNAKTAAQMQSVKLELVEMLGGSCVNCGYNRSVAALHFNHLGIETKKNNIGTLIGQKLYAQAREEAKKCNLLCANCHAEYTWPQFIKEIE